MQRKEVEFIKQRLCEELVRNPYRPCKWAKTEYPVYRPKSFSLKSRCLVDVYGSFDGIAHKAEKGIITKGVGIEFKSSHSDFNTGNGQNFDFYYNLFCTIPEMEKYAK